MAMAIPVLHGVRGESADIVEGEDIGITFEPENPRELCNGLMQLANDKVLFQRLKSNGPKAAKGYDRRKLAAKMMKIIESLD
jgi:glycosyltransferase involved in cell wall biosynthesis